MFPYVRVRLTEKTGQLALLSHTYLCSLIVTERMGEAFPDELAF